MSGKTGFFKSLLLAKMIVALGTIVRKRLQHVLQYGLRTPLLRGKNKAITKENYDPDPGCSKGG